MDRRYGVHVRRIKRSRRSLFICLLCAVTILYLFSKWIPSRITPANIPNEMCLDVKLDSYSREVDDMSTIINHQPIKYGEIVSLPFTGNGYIGLSLSLQSRLQLMYDRTFVSTAYSPLVQITSDTWHESSANVLQMRTGLVRRISCFKHDGTKSAYVKHLLYAHRTKPSLLIQEVEISNPSDYTLDLDFKQIDETKSSTTTKQLDQQDISFTSDVSSSNDLFTLTTSQISVRPHNNNFVIMVTLSQKLRTTQAHIKPGSDDKFTLYLITKFSSLLSDNLMANDTYVRQYTQTLQKQAKEDMISALQSSIFKLRKEHIDAWNSIWHSGFSISRSLAPQATNGDIINRTLYYILCSTPAPLYDLRLNETKREELKQNLYQTDRCYDEHSTLAGKKLWLNRGDDLAVSQLNSLWRLTLGKKGCTKLLQSGADGILQAMLLSVGGLRFRNHHLEMYLDPKDLHRDMLFYRINFGKNLQLNITLQVELDNRAVIYASVDKDDSNSYACDAGCLDAPAKLSTTPVRFPVKMTQPPTAILYVTEDFEHISQLKDTIHVREVEIAPPHGHDILALHRHGHKLGGLPLTFWISLIILILIFHLFLLKIVLNEMGYFNKQILPTHNRPRVL
ncbi:unnamed protein product [Didymodactylos carnosus]|uniref:Uncharacterized protein n=1 Tax=Didymodactylos carnosus TaxID=1234261 RepID=A0A813XNX9_9BILA|nr:unnamed protein product [Didymodactylos carnosus]CAF1008900.1 unnamed protein product [Didymodactylos carnosus]CAF3655394.1 unnamed protein product [Didymodactylos carnosus]CAF3777821.1 unnamed protein product [Didymodactylos carnosus]